MTKVMIVYFSKTGNTAKLAEAIAVGASEAGAEVVVKPVSAAKPTEMLDYDVVIAGSPTYYGHSAGVLRTFFDESVSIHGRLNGKIGGAFATSAYKSGGNETTILDILHAFMIHGMVVKGQHSKDHYGPTSINTPNEPDIKDAKKYGAMLVNLAERLSNV